MLEQVFFTGPGGELPAGAPAVARRALAACRADLEAAGWTFGHGWAGWSLGNFRATAWSRELAPGTYGDSAAAAGFARLGRHSYTFQARKRPAGWPKERRAAVPVGLL